MNILGLKNPLSGKTALRSRVVAALKTATERCFPYADFFFTWGCFFLKGGVWAFRMLKLVSAAEGAG